MEEITAVIYLHTHPHTRSALTSFIPQSIRRIKVPEALKIEAAVLRKTSRKNVCLVAVCLFL